MPRPDPHTQPDDARWMQRALTLARASVGQASPNPQVGCVVVRDGKVLGKGAHFYDRLDHAEIVALKQARSAGHDTGGATAYVTLEPCSHQGRTPPCADALIAAGIARCVVATADPNPAVSGTGIRKLQAAGIAVEVGLLQEPARALNEAFALSITHGRPFVTLKAGLSVDGQLAPAVRTERAPFFLTGPAAREEVQHLRHSTDVIVTGIGTVMADDPLLTDRTGLPRRRPLMRAILDSHLRTPLTSRLVDSVAEDLWFFCSPEASARAERSLEAAGARVSRVSGTDLGLDLAAVLNDLHQAKFLSALLETGSALNGAFLKQDLVDRVILYFAPTELGAEAVSFARGSAGPFALEQRLKKVQKRDVVTDVCVTGLLHDPWATRAQP